MRAPVFTRSLLLMLAGGVGAGCGDDLPGSPLAGAGGIMGAGGLGTPSGAAGAGGAGPAAGPSATPAGGVRVFGGTARMLASGPSCTQEAGATGDRWCAFLAYGTDSDRLAQIRSLYVFNASRAVAGQTVVCDPAIADPSCLLLTANLGVDAGGPALHGTFFQGDSLVYYEYQQGKLAPYVWRPGMPAGRLLATFATEEDAVYCTPAPRGTAVVCVLLPERNPDPNVGYATLLLGKADGAAEPLLSAADNVIVWNADDAGFQQAFSFGFPPGPGDPVAWTTRDTASGPEVLKMQAAGEPGSRRAVASGVHQWQVSPDGARWFWLRPDGGVITLQRASFPTGEGPVDVYADVVDYSLGPADGTVVARTVDGTLVAIADHLGGTSETVLDTEVRALQSFSATGYVAYSKTYFDATSGDLYVKSADGTGACVLEATHPVPFGLVSFSPDGAAILWAHSHGDGFEAHYGRLRDCDAMSVANDITLIKPMGGQRVLYVDGYDEATGTGTLQVRPVAGDNTLAGAAPARVAGQVDSYAILGLPGPMPQALVYTVNGGPAGDGVHVSWYAD